MLSLSHAPRTDNVLLGDDVETSLMVKAYPVATVEFEQPGHCSQSVWDWVFPRDYGLLYFPGNSMVFLNQP
jgi:hypothetical protein